MVDLCKAKHRIGAHVTVGNNTMADEWQKDRNVGIEKQYMRAVLGKDLLLRPKREEFVIEMIICHLRTSAWSSC